MDTLKITPLSTSRYFSNVSCFSFIPVRVHRLGISIPFATQDFKYFTETCFYAEAAVSINCTRIFLRRIQLGIVFI